jgi:hypothetical protein
MAATGRNMLFSYDTVNITSTDTYIVVLLAMKPFPLYTMDSSGLRYNQVADSCKHDGFHTRCVTCGGPLELIITTGTEYISDREETLQNVEGISRTKTQCTFRLLLYSHRYISVSFRSEIHKRLFPVRET